MNMLPLTIRILCVEERVLYKPKNCVYNPKCPRIYLPKPKRSGFQWKKAVVRDLNESYKIKYSGLGKNELSFRKYTLAIISKVWKQDFAILDFRKSYTV